MSSLLVVGQFEMPSIILDFDGCKVLEFLRLLPKAPQQVLNRFAAHPETFAHLFRVESNLRTAGGTGKVTVRLKPTNRLTKLMAAIRASKNHNVVSK
jgi:hypothetical protein